MAKAEHHHYADPGFRGGVKRYKLDTEKNVRAAWSYINMPKNARFYNAKQLSQIKRAIMAAMRKRGINVYEAHANRQRD